jgi:PII-like signaling protein
MKGYQLEFFMEQSIRYGHQALYEWLIGLAHSQGISGATVCMGAMGFGHHSRMHSSHFFELADQPVLVTMVVKEDESIKLFEILEKENVHLFYVKMPVEFGSVGKLED